jgi:hypothetical protein
MALWLGCLLLSGCSLTEEEPSSKSEELAASLAGEFGHGAAGCTKQRAKPFWLCAVETDQGSGYGPQFKVAIDSEECWSAVPVRVKTLKQGKDARPKLVALVRSRALTRDRHGCIGEGSTGPFKKGGTGHLSLK